MMTSTELERRLRRIERALVAIYRMVWPFLPGRMQKEAERTLVPIMRDMAQEVDRNG